MSAEAAYLRWHAPRQPAPDRALAALRRLEQHRPGSTPAQTAVAVSHAARILRGKA